MKNVIYTILFTLLLLFNTTNGFSLNCSVDIAQFIAQDDPFLDVSLRIDGESCVYMTDDKGYYSSSILVQMIFTHDDDVMAFEKYKLITENQTEIKDMLDLRRFFLKPNSYEIDIKLIDVNDTTNVFQYKSKVEVRPKSEQKMSNALVLFKIEKATDESPLNRNGLYMEPQPYMKIGNDQKVFQLYQEIYRNQFDNDKLIYKINIVQNDLEEGYFPSEPLVKYKKIGNQDVEPILTTFDITKLTSGNYDIITSIIDINKNTLYEDKVGIIINNRLADISSVKDYNKVYGNSFVNEMDSSDVVYALKAIVPITNYKMMSTLSYIIKHSDLAAQKYYLFKHWNDTYPGLSEAGYTKYMKIAKAVDKDFYSTVGHGFQTDRGYIYLKYGKPNKFITVVDEPNAPPYEIWYYYFLEQTRQTDVRFIFYDPLQVNNFELLHSTCYTERSNPAWETLLYKFNEDERIGHTIIATEVEENWGRRAKKLFNDF